MNKQQECLDQVLRGVGESLFCLEFCLQTLEELDSHVAEINRVGTGKRFFASLQVVLGHDATLYTAKVFECSARHDQRTLPSALDYIDQNQSHFVATACPEAFEFLELNVSPPNLTRAIVDRARQQLPARTGTRSIDQAYQRVIELRNKRVAHSDKVIGSSRPTWQDIEDLRQLGRTISRVLNLSFLSVSQQIARDAEGCQHSLRDLLKKAGITHR